MKHLIAVQLEIDSPGEDEMSGYLAITRAMVLGEMIDEANEREAAIGEEAGEDVMGENPARIVSFLMAGHGDGFVSEIPGGVQ